MRPSSETAREGGHQEQLLILGLVEGEEVEAEGATMMTLRRPTNIVPRPKPRQLRREPLGQFLPKRKKVGDRAFGLER